ncbi:MAG: hypothetical protein U5K56_07180 [Halioglobus sp.]|nr:hypothetical protein [Halioglobus sp.]
MDDSRESRDAFVEKRDAKFDCGISRPFSRARRAGGALESSPRACDGGIHGSSVRRTAACAGGTAKSQLVISATCTVMPRGRAVISATRIGNSCVIRAVIPFVVRAAIPLMVRAAMALMVRAAMALVVRAAIPLMVHAVIPAKAGIQRPSIPAA